MGAGCVVRLHMAKGQEWHATDLCHDVACDGHFVCANDGSDGSPRRSVRTVGNLPNPRIGMQYQMPRPWWGSDDVRRGAWPYPGPLARKCLLAALEFQPS